MREPETLLPEAVTKVDPAPIATAGPPDINKLMEIALSHGEGGVAALEKLVSLQERMEDREAERAFARSLLAFQNSCPVVKKTSAAFDKHGKKMYGFTKIDYLVKTITPYTQPQGLSWTWEDDENPPEGTVRVFTTIRHTGGHSVTTRGSAFPIPEPNQRTNKTQCVAIARGYAMRYGLASGLGFVMGGEDTDGRAEEEFITEKQANEIHDKINTTKTDPSKFLKFMGVDQIGHIPQSKYKKAIDGLKAQG